MNSPYAEACASYIFNHEQEDFFNWIECGDANGFLDKEEIDLILKEGSDPVVTKATLKIFKKIATRHVYASAWLYLRS